MTRCYICEKSDIMIPNSMEEKTERKSRRLSVSATAAEL